MWSKLSHDSLMEDNHLKSKLYSLYPNTWEKGLRPINQYSSTKEWTKMVSYYAFGRKTSIRKASSTACIQIIGGERDIRPIHHFSSILIEKINSQVWLNFERDTSIRTPSSTTYIKIPGEERGICRINNFSSELIEFNWETFFWFLFGKLFDFNWKWLLWYLKIFPPLFIFSFNP